MGCGVEISGRRLLADLARLATFGGRPDGGVDRMAGTAADLRSRAWLAERLQAAGLRPRRDGTGNVFGCRADARGVRLLVGSHTDTVPAGGRLDGAYGVLAALEVARSLSEAGHPAAAAIEVVSFWDEEGAQPDAAGGLVGSTAFCEQGDLGEIGGYLELHIEQGPRMETAGLELAVVDGIVGVDRYRVTVEGEPNHAGTTPLELRSDASRVVARVLAQLWDLIRAIDPEMVGNAGCLDLEPGAPNVVPGLATMTVELRAPGAASLDAAAGALAACTRRAAAQERCAATVTRLSRKPPARFDLRLCALVEQACRDSGRPTGRLTSYAGHDAGVLSRHVPCAMTFVPSSRGVSHAPQEYTEPQLLIQGAQALLESVVAATAHVAHESQRGSLGAVAAHRH